MNTEKEKISELLKTLINASLSDCTLWDMNDIAHYMRLSKSSVQQRIITTSGFPKAIRLPTTDNGGQRRWQPKEVKAWAARFKEAG